MDDYRELLSGSTLFMGPSNVGKTKTTAALLDAWTETRGGDGVVVLDFAPVVEREDGTILGGRLTQFTTPPADGWTGTLDAHAPRATGDSIAATLELARRNGENARRLVAAAPEPTALFVNDATIPFQHPDADAGWLLDMIAQADCAVLNAFESTEIGRTDPVSRAETEALDVLRRAVDRVRRLG